MTRDEIKVIADIVGGDDTYRHFVHRINKEFDAADIDRNAQVKVLFKDIEGDLAGFCVIGISPAKMKIWSEMFVEEGWVDGSFNIDPNAHELMYMYIKPEYRGKGMGKELLNQAFEHSKSSGTNEVYAYVSDRTSDSLDFYKSNEADIIHDFSDEEISTAFIKWDLI